MALDRAAAAAGTAKSRQEEGDEEHYDHHENYRQGSSLLVAVPGGPGVHLSQPPGWLASLWPSVPVNGVGGELCQGLDR
jgi:hypothetical protein